MASNVARRQHAPAGFKDFLIFRPISDVDNEFITDSSIRAHHVSPLTHRRHACAGNGMRLAAGRCEAPAQDTQVIPRIGDVRAPHRYSVAPARPFAARATSCHPVLPGDPSLGRVGRGACLAQASGTTGPATSTRQRPQAGHQPKKPIGDAKHRPGEMATTAAGHASAIDLPRRPAQHISANIHIFPGH